MGWQPKLQTPGKLACETPPASRVKKSTHSHDASARTQRDLLSQRPLQLHTYPARVEDMAYLPAGTDLLNHQRIRIQPDVLVISGVPGMVQQRPRQGRDLQTGERQHKPRPLPCKERSDHERRDDNREGEPAKLAR